MSDNQEQKYKRHAPQKHDFSVSVIDAFKKTGLFRAEFSSVPRTEVINILYSKENLILLSAKQK